MFDGTLGVLEWEFQFLVPISGTPIGSGILILFSVPNILVGFFFRMWLLKSHQIEIPVPKFRIPEFCSHRNSVYLMLYQKTIAISFPAKITSTCKQVGVILAGKIVMPPKTHLLVLLGK
jgi:hypothetical protein